MAGAQKSVRLNGGGLGEQRQRAPIKHRARHAEFVEQSADDIAAAEAVDDVQHQSEADHHDADFNGAEHQAHRIARQRIVPEREFFKLRKAETTAVKRAENHARTAAEQKQQADIAPRRAAIGEQQNQSAERENGAVPDVAKHHAEHQQITDGDEQRRFQLVVFRQAVSRDQHRKRPQPARMPQQNRNFFFVQLFCRCRFDDAAPDA